MDKLSALSRGTQIMLGAGVLLLIDTFLAWQEISVEILGVEAASASANAWHGFWGIVMGLALILLLAWIVASIAGIDIPLPVSGTMIAAVLAAIIVVVALSKNLVDDSSTIWSYIGIVLAAAVAFGAWLQLQSAGGMDTLRSEMGSMRSSSASERPTATTPAPPAAEPTPPPAAPSSPPPPADPPPASGEPSR
jgi:hypothetical protein